MVSIRPFEEGDNTRLLDIEKLCPQGNEKYARGMDKRDIIARYELYDNWNVLVAEEEGKVVGLMNYQISAFRGRWGEILGGEERLRHQKRVIKEPTRIYGFVLDEKKNYNLFISRRYNKI